MKKFNELYATYYKSILFFIKSKMNDKDIAEDIASQTFINVYNSLDKFDGDRGNIKAWIYKIAKNKVIDYYRANASKTPVLSLDMEMNDETCLGDSIPDNHTATDEMVINKETKTALDVLMKSKLDENEMKLMNLFCDGYRYKEISESEGLDIQNVKNILHKARLKMRACESEVKTIVL